MQHGEDGSPATAEDNPCLTDHEESASAIEFKSNTALSSSSNRIPVIIGSVMGGLVLLGGIISIIYCYRKGRGVYKQDVEMTNVQV